jgi:chromosome segregation ATPase
MEMEAETLRTEGDKETASLKREIAKYSEQNAVLANEVKSQEDDISRLRDSLVSYESNENDVFVELEKAREELSVLNAAQQDLQNNLDQSHTLIDSLRKDVDIKDKLLKSSEDAYSEEVSNSNKKLKELTEELDKLREQQKSIEISNNELDNAISNKVSIIESLTQMNEQLTSQIEILSSEKEEIIKELDELRNSIQKSDESMISFDEKVYNSKSD